MKTKNKVMALVEIAIMLRLMLIGSTANFMSATYMVKWFYPKIFEDLVLKAIHQGYLTRFQRLDYNLDEHGVCVYPEVS